MKIDGKAIAHSILSQLTIRISELKEEGVTPHLAVILIGDDASSQAYVRQKELKAAQIGAAISIHRFQKSFTEEALLSLIADLNSDPIVHGIIIQRPLPAHIDGEKVTQATTAEKDVDGFRTDSPFDPPIAKAVLRILREVYQQDDHSLSFEEWLKRKKNVILGKGKTAGRPIIRLFKKRQYPLTIIDSSTVNRQELLAGADVVISAIGKPALLSHTDIKEGSILVGVGMTKGEDGKLHGDFEGEDIQKKAGYFTTVPGGVGPVNVAMLLRNLVDAAENN